MQEAHASMPKTNGARSLIDVVSKAARSQGGRIFLCDDGRTSRGRMGRSHASRQDDLA